MIALLLQLRKLRLSVVAWLARGRLRLTKPLQLSPCHTASVPFAHCAHGSQDLQPQQ